MIPAPLSRSASSLRLHPKHVLFHLSRFRFCMAALCVVFVAAGCGDDALNTEGSKHDEPVFENERTIGNPAVYERIAGMTSCTALQAEFDIAGDNTDRIQDEGGDASIPRSYMDAAHNRMREVGCYG